MGMALRTRLAVLAITAIFAAAPSLALAADCLGCCCPPAPCHGAAADCDSFERAMSCGEIEPAAATCAALRVSQPPAFDLLPSYGLVATASASRMPLPARAGRLEPRASPARLSVVRRN